MFQNVKEYTNGVCSQLCDAQRLAKFQKLVCKGYILYDSNCMAFRKMERYIVSVKIPKFRGISMQESLESNRNSVFYVLIVITVLRIYTFVELNKAVW